MTFEVAVVIPAYNEERRVAGVVAGVRAVLPEALVIVVDDGSRDLTADVARDAGAQVVPHPFNLGYGAAVQTGYKFALAKGCRFVVQIDGDGQHDPASIPKLLAPLQAGTADLVIGSRFLGGDSYRPPAARRLGMLFFRWIVSLLIGQRITDSTTGYQAFNLGILKYFCSEIFPVDYPDADLLLTVHRAGFRITEVPVRMFANVEGKSMHGGLRPLYYVVKMLLSIFVTLLRRQPPVGGKRSR